MVCRPAAPVGSRVWLRAGRRRYIWAARHARTHLSRAGWSKRSLAPGEKVDLTYYKLRDGRRGGFNVTVKRENGTTLNQLPVRE